MPAETTDADLARAWAAGDERAYDAIVTRFAPLVFGRCRRALGAADADDATQAVFLVLAHRREQAAASPALAAWLMTVAGHVVRNAWRDRRRRRQAESSMPPPEPRDEEPAMPGIQDHLDACLAELPQRERDAIVLHHLAGHTLAEVAQQTGSGLSTVHDRIARGLERLRALLAKRGVVLGGATLAAALAAEAQAAVPPEVLVHLRDLHPAGGGAGSAAAPSDRVRRWSRQRSSAMSRIALTAVGLLLAGGAVWHILPSSEAAAHPPVPPVPAPWPKLIGDPIRDLDPEHARTWMVLRANGGARTVQRLRAQPEMLLMPVGTDAVLEAIASMREAVVVADLDSLRAPRERAQAYRMVQDRCHEGAAALADADGSTAVRDGKTLSDMTFRLAETRPDPQTPGRTEAAGTAPGTAASASFNFRLPDFFATITGTSPDASLLARLRAGMDAAAPLITPDPAGHGWIYRNSTGDGRISIVGSQVNVGAPVGMPLMPASIPTTAGDPGADVEFASFLDPGRPGAVPVRVVTGSLRIDDAGLRFAVAGAAAGHRTMAVFDRRRFDRVPSAAVLAMGMAMHADPADDASFNALVGKLVRMPDEAGRTAVQLFVGHADGTTLAWIEPGTPWPILTLESDYSQADAEALFTTAGLARSADGTATVMAGTQAYAIGWRDGRLVVTTNPAGLDGVSRVGGFTAHPEIGRALAALPTGGLAACALLRPAAALDLAMPFGVMLVPDLQRPLMDYRTAVGQAEGFGFLCLSSDGGRARIDAGGILALVGCAILAKQAGDPASLLRLAD